MGSVHRRLILTLHSSQVTKNRPPSQAVLLYLVGVVSCFVMKHTTKDLLGQKFTRWLVVDSSEKKGGRTAWKVKCDCGKISRATTNQLTRGQTKSCGCLQRERAKQHMTKHGQRYTPLYRRWLGMRSRCSVKAPQKKDYYDRGIGVCSEWDNFMNFKKDMGGSFKQELTLDRIDNNKGYFKENCRWVDRETQNNNQKRSHRVKHKGNEYTIREFCEKYNLVYNTIRIRVKQGGRRYQVNPLSQNQGCHHTHPVCLGLGRTTRCI